MSIRQGGKGTDVFFIFDEETQKELNGINSIEHEKLKEMVRHNQVMESGIKIKSQREAHEYRMILFRDCREFKKNGMSDEKIVTIFPEMKDFCKLQSN